MFLQPTWTPAEFYDNKWALMQWYTCKSLLNTLGRAVEQLAGALPLSSTQASKSQHSRSKFKSHALPARKVMNIEYYQLSCLESRFTTTPKTARCCRKESWIFLLGPRWVACHLLYTSLKSLPPLLCIARAARVWLREQRASSSCGGSWLVVVF